MLSRACVRALWIIQHIGMGVPLLPSSIFFTSTKSTPKFQVKANFITNSDWFQVGRPIGNYGFMNVTTSSTDQYSLGGGLKTQDVQEGSVKSGT